MIFSFMCMYLCRYILTSFYWKVPNYLLTRQITFLTKHTYSNYSIILKFQASTTRPRANTVLTGGGYWGSRPPSPTGGDNASETSSVMPPPPSQQIQRPKSRAESKYDNLSYWRARKVSYYFIRYLPHYVIFWYWKLIVQKAQ